MQYSFGAGNLFGRKISASGVPTPVQFGAVQGVNIDFSFTNKELRGQNQFPLAVARGAGKITGKCQFGQLNAQAINDLFFGQAAGPSTTTLAVSLNEAQTVASNNVTAANNSTFIGDLGVLNATTGIPLLRVVSAPSGTGNYSCNETTGVYTFNNTMNGTGVLISYEYTDTAGKTITITNQQMGSAPTFMAVFYEVYNGKRVTMQLNSCISSQLTFNTKLEDFTVPDFSFEAQVDAAGNIAKISLDE